MFDINCFRKLNGFPVDGGGPTGLTGLGGSGLGGGGGGRGVLGRGGSGRVGGGVGGGVGLVVITGLDVVTGL